MKVMWRASLYPKDQDYGWMVTGSGSCEICALGSQCPSPSSSTLSEEHVPHLCICITGPGCVSATSMHLYNGTQMYIGHIYASV